MQRLKKLFAEDPAIAIAGMACPFFIWAAHRDLGINEPWHVDLAILLGFSATYMMGLFFYHKIIRPALNWADDALRQILRIPSEH